ncbi:vesicle transport through interaction with t-SNAREs homolog 1A isoform X5 [Apteryx rowi]|uniref:vesicle transport through interaction with t-SNAREs homolog 1A isoform X5 n=1 Tax=Apteryx rowi TaxID=308060 RepID=UPI000E1C7309|nr:vesicle transport through interaction with t-SNAREs homolog 1A isoform X5 [Apteryx rowi]
MLNNVKTIPASAFLALTDDIVAFYASVADTNSMPGCIGSPAGKWLQTAYFHQELYGFSRRGRRKGNQMDEKKQMVANVEKQLEEARELLEQMELEVREIPPQSRGMYSSRMRSYKQEMGKLEADFKRSRIAYSDEVRNELLGDDGNSSENQLIKLREERAHLLDNTERLERSSRRLEAGYQIAVETEQIGQEMLENLSHDREKIQRARERLRETDANLGKSSRILTGMLRRVNMIQGWTLQLLQWGMFSST